jgi:hypothetical protein
MQEGGIQPKEVKMMTTTSKGYMVKAKKEKI